jgi:hypothetical protein
LNQQADARRAFRQARSYTSRQGPQRRNTDAALGLLPNGIAAQATEYIQGGYREIIATDGLASYRSVIRILGGQRHHRRSSFEMTLVLPNRAFSELTCQYLHEKEMSDSLTRACWAVFHFVMYDWR